MLMVILFSLKRLVMKVLDLKTYSEVMTAVSDITAVAIRLDGNRVDSFATAAEELYEISKRLTKIFDSYELVKR